MPQRKGSIRLFRFLGVEVFLHWSWFLVAVFEIQSRAGKYSSILWNVLEYLALFAIVLTHEYGHALACRQVGDGRIRLCYGRWAASPTLTRRNARARLYGALQQARW